MEDLDVEDWIQKEKSKEKAIKKILNDIESRKPITYYENEEKKEGSDKLKTNLIESIMNKITKILNKMKHLAIWVFLLCLASGYAQSNKGLVPQKIRVKIEPSAVTLLHKNLEQSSKENKLETGFAEINKLNNKYGATKMKRVFPHAGKNESKHMKYGLHLWYEITINDSQASLQKVANDYENNLNILHSEPIRVKTLEKSKIVEVPEVNTTTSAVLSTNDPYLPSQWHYNNDGSLEGSIAGSDINLFEAWEITQGKSNVIVAVVDGGIDVDHVDLQDNMWINEAELNGEPGVDDDFNGYVDDIHGYNFVDNSGQITDQEHGTHVAGTVSAVNNNGKGVAGVAGGSGNNDGAKLISCQVFADNGGGNFAAAIVYGADNGAVISQNSWGYQLAGQYEQSVLDAIDYFIAEAGSYPNSPMKGGVVIFAAGNNNNDLAHYPGYYENAISVASIGTNFKRAYYSNYGDWVDIASVGGDIRLGTKNGVLSTFPDNKYGYLQGTSMATPHVSGIAALVISKYGSSTFTNEMLKDRLLTSVKNIDVYNPDYSGKLGAGYIDAAMALAENDMTAPMIIDNLTVTGVSQDFAKVSWQVPVDEKDGTPFGYEIYYSKDSNFASKDMMVVANNFSEVGETIEAEIVDLEFLTTYYIAVAAVDRWGNTSEMSNIVEITTNSGPDISSDKFSLNIPVDVTATTQASDVFNILNNDNGVLNWTVEARQIRAIQSKNSVQYPKQGTIKSFNQINVIKQEVAEVEKFPTKQNKASKWEPEDLKYYNNVSYVIGDVDSTLTNSAATRFKITNPEGFNLTRVSSYMQLDKEDGPAIFEVYKGEQVIKENLVYSAELNAFGENDIRNYSHALKEQLFFEEGETFWLVFHAPSGNLYPLGIGAETSPEYSDNCFMSFDLGKTWQPISQAIESDIFVWAVTASSTTEPLATYTTFTPEAGSISGIGQEEVTVDIDASKLINGTYKSNIVVRSNDVDTPNYRIPLDVVVKGQESELTSVNILDFGHVFNGLSSTKEMTITNQGYGRFRTLSVSSSDPQFVVNTSRFALNIPALDERPLQITFTPNSVGNKNAVITLTDDAGKQFKFNVFAVSIEPAQMSIEKSVYNFDNVQIGDEPVDTIKITNTGQYPLQYGFPNFKSDVSYIENLPENIQRFPYTMEKMDYPVGYVFNDITSSGTDITNFFKQNSKELYQKVDLGFDFPFFGEIVGELYVTRNGLLTLETNSVFNATSTFHGTFMPNGYISAIVKEFAFAQQGSVHYKKDPGKFTVQYTNVRHANDPETASITLQIVIYDTGDIELIYDNIVGFPSYIMRGFYTAIENRAKNDGLLINSNRERVYLPHKAYQIVKIHSPGRGLIKDVVSSGGIIQPGETAELVMTVDKDKLIEGSFKEYISVLSNDPFRSSESIEVNINVTGGGASTIVVAPENVDFGDVFQNEEVTGSIGIENLGTKEISTKSIQFKNGQLTHETADVTVIKPNQTLYVNYTLLTNTLGAIDDVLEVVDENDQMYSVPFTGTIIDAPKMEVVEPSYAVTMNPDETATTKFTVKNSGKATLEYAIANTEHLTLETANNTTGEYAYISRTTYNEENKPSFQWYRLTEDDKVPFNVQNSDFWEAINLPFEFNFYNQKYSKLWMGTQGVLSFDEIKDESLNFFSPNPVPTADEVNNIIAPYFAAGGPNTSLPEDQRGRYFKAYEDKLVFEWRNYLNIFGFGSEYSFQAILYKDGTIKFQYKENIPTRARAFYGLIGIENQAATEAVQIAHYQDFLADGVAVEIIPANKYTLEANTSQEFDVTYSSVDVNAGTYNDAIYISSNDPLNRSVRVPFDITVGGDPVLTYIPETIDLGEKVVLPNQEYYEEFQLANTGKATLNVGNLRLKDPANAVIERYVFNFRWGWRWVPISSRDSFVIEPGFESETLRITFSPTEPNDNYSNAVMATINDGSTVELPITAIFKAPPAFTINADPIYKMAYNDDVLPYVLNLGNENGQSPLNYKLSMTYNRGTTTQSEKQSKSETVKNNSFLQKSSKAFTKKQNAKNAESKGDIVEILSYEEESGPYTSFGYNGIAVFSSATEFIAPASGFDLSHVQTWYVPGDWLNSDIEVEIRVGAFLENATPIHKETFNYTIESSDSYGSLLTFELGESVKIFPYEKFYLVISFPLGATFPQGAVRIETPVKDRYRYYNGGFWYDLYASGAAVRNFAWMNRVGSDTTSQLNWLTHVEEGTGSIEPGNTKDITLEFYPSRTLYPKNTANILIETNDPNASLTSINATLEINQAPELVTEQIYYVYESETLSLELEVKDLEGDAITNVALVENYPNVTFDFVNGTANFSYTPTYEDEGVYTFVFETEDENAVKGNSTITVEVMNKNRAPVANTLETKYMNLYNGEVEIVYNETMQDPDGDTLSFTYNIEDTSIVTAYISDEKLLLKPLAKGTTNVVITGKDAMGASTISTVQIVVVDSIESNEELEDAIDVHPNPVVDIMNVKISNPVMEPVFIKVINGTTGTTVKTFNEEKIDSDVGLPVNDLVPGIYFVQFQTKNAKWVKKIAIE
ncbi:S8 family serine peptidase [Tenacibaculum tangerinum]|uniref:S8 family serine peptidase n=1 Tax=Tenacibaculum tangerinum TaxID=3038772 RepID=A0ABY8KYM8_9FLAO|nr:S8 family serine peptidase [Tenacibaculum tangerinum]WGH74134.1 S8 family serine peptidase [Tenacibaculum tangerinum]